MADIQINTPWGAVINGALAIINKVIPDPAARAQAQLQVLQLQQAGEFKEMELAANADKAQTDIDLEEAKSSDWFKSRARPALMWVGVLGMFYQWLVLPLGTFIYILWTGHQLPAAPPAIDPNLFLTLSGLLGLHIVGRSYEKAKGVA